jgi:hypothetical protein
VHRAGQVWGSPKGHTRRKVPIPAFLVEELVRHVEGRGPDELVFTGVRGGGALRATVFRRATFDDAAAAIGLPGLHPHELRHTAASLAIAAGADVKVVQQMLGHASAAMTLDQYGHLFGDRLDQVAEAMDAARAAVVYPMCSRSEIGPGEAIGKSGERGADLRLRVVPPAGFEPAHPPPEGHPTGSPTCGQAANSAVDLQLCRWPRMGETGHLRTFCGLSADSVRTKIARCRFVDRPSGHEGEPRRPERPLHVFRRTARSLGGSPPGSDRAGQYR